METEKKEKRKITKLEDCITPDGLQISGMGVLMANSKREVELLDKIQKFLFFMEKRQQEIFQWMQDHQ